MHNRPPSRSRSAENFGRYKPHVDARRCRAHPVRHRTPHMDMCDATFRVSKTIQCHRSRQSPARLRSAECWLAPGALRNLSGYRLTQLKHGCIRPAEIRENPCAFVAILFWVLIALRKSPCRHAPALLLLLSRLRNLESCPSKAVAD